MPTTKDLSARTIWFSFKSLFKSIEKGMINRATLFCNSNQFFDSAERRAADKYNNVIPANPIITLFCAIVKDDKFLNLEKTKPNKKKNIPIVDHTRQ